MITRIFSNTTVLVLLLASNMAWSEEDWKFAAEVYSWLPNIDVKQEVGTNAEITLDDILDNLDMVAMTALAASRGKWSFGTDVIYMDLSNNDNEVVAPGQTLKKIELEAWILTPVIGYTVHQTEKQVVRVYAGARYLWLDAILTLDVANTPPQQDSRVKADESGSKWDAIVGVSGRYDFAEHWYMNYSLNAGAGQSDFTGQANAAVAYEFNSFDVALGWRYMTWEEDNAIEELTINGPYIGAVFRF